MRCCSPFSSRCSTRCPRCPADCSFGFPPRAIVLLALHLCTLVTRNTLEPKLISAQAGLPPVASLFAMYLGYCTFGVAGMILFPFFLLLLSQVAGKHEGETT